MVKTYSGADVLSDYNPVVCRMRLKLKKLIKGKTKTGFDVNLLKDAKV